jgi:signal transduction histidine kinase
MRHFPAIDCGPGHWILPMADRTASLLTDLLLAEERVGLSGALADVLGDDPPSVLWAAVVAARGGHRLSTVSDLAEWLAHHALAVLQWPPESREFPQPSEKMRQRLVALVRESVSLGLLAAELDSAGPPLQRQSAGLAGLLHNAARWFAELDATHSGSVPSQLGQWLSGLSAQAVNTADMAAAILAGDRPSPGVDLAAIRRRAGQTAKRWADPVPGAGDRLPILAARLARLEQLELRYCESLESAKLEAMAELAAGAGHEINNPLAVIGGRAQLFLQEETDPEWRREAAVIVAQVKRAHEMIADLMLFARPPKPEPQPFDLAAVVDALLAELAPAAAERSIEVVRTGPGGALAVELDRAQIGVAVQALVRNAIEAIGHQGRIEVGLEGNEEWATIRVADNGPGIAPEHRQHVFDPFYSARQAGRGLGMGLSKCWRIVTNHGGQIGVEDAPSRGAVFTVRLPRRYCPKQCSTP